MDDRPLVHHKDFGPEVTKHKAVTQIVLLVSQQEIKYPIGLHLFVY